MPGTELGAGATDMTFQPLLFRSLQFRRESETLAENYSVEWLSAEYSRNKTGWETDSASIQAESETGNGRDDEPLGPLPVGWSLPTVRAPHQRSQGQ